MRNTNKKGFTIVELVIVVAVIAILAAVLIPTFTGIIAKANLSADQVAVKNMNTVLSTEFATATPASIKEVVDALDENGFNVNSLTPLTKDHRFLWNVGTKTIVLVNAEGVVIYPEKAELANEHKDLYEDGASYINAEVENEADLATALANGNDITLTKDIAISAALTVRGDVTINLNGKTLDASAREKGRVFDLADGAKLTIDATGSTIKCGEYGLVNISKDANVDIVINGGTYTADLNNGSFIKPRGNGNVNITLNDVNYTDVSTDSYIVNTKDSTGKVEIIVNGGNYKSAYGIAAKYITVDGATIETSGYAVLASKEAVVKNSTITTGNANDGMPAGCVAVQAGGSATVTNCTLSSANAALVTASSSGRIVANGNTITGEVYQNNANSKHPGETKTVVYIEIDGKVEVDKTFE